MNKFWKVPQLDYVGNRNQHLNNSLHCIILTILKFARSNIRNLLLVYDFNQIIWLKDFKSSKNFKSWNNSRHHVFSIFYPQLGSWANENTQLCKIVIYLFPSLCISPHWQLIQIITFLPYHHFIHTTERIWLRAFFYQIW